MATTAARDDRLTPQAKAFLQVLRARCAKGRETKITKGTAGNVMSRSTRTIRRYLVDLVRFGYVQLAIQRDGRGMHLGQVVTITEKVRPFYEETKSLAAWLAEKPKADGVDAPDGIVVPEWVFQPIHRRRPCPRLPRSAWILRRPCSTPMAPTSAAGACSRSV